MIIPCERIPLQHLVVCEDQLWVDRKSNPLPMKKCSSMFSHKSWTLPAQEPIPTGVRHIIKLNCEEKKDYNEHTAIIICCFCRFDCAMKGGYLKKKTHKKKEKWWKRLINTHCNSQLESSIPTMKSKLQKWIHIELKNLHKTNNPSISN